MTATQRLDALPAGQELHAYRIERILGSGAFGITYLATHGMLLSRHVIKEYLPDTALREQGLTVRPKSDADKEIFEWGLNSFFEEARLLHRLSNPYIVKVTDLFQANGTAYFIMPYLEGITLHKWINDHPKATQQELEDIFIPLLEGLKYIHEQGLLHRDIKPENIFLTESGDPVLIDFGSARFALGAKSRTLTQVLTPRYAPFEQYSSTGKFTPALDLYSLAACMYEAITHKLPEEAPQRMEEDAQPKLANSKYAQKYTQAFLSAIDKALEVRARDRFQNAFDFQRALLGHLDSSGQTGDSASLTAAKTEVHPATVAAKPEAHSLFTPVSRSWIITLLIILFVGLLAIGYMQCSRTAEQAEVTDKKEEKQAGKTEEAEPEKKPEKTKPEEEIEETEPEDEADEKTPQALFEQAQELEKNKKYAEAVELYQKAAEQGLAEAQNQLGEMYFYGRGVKKDRTEAIEWYKIAANQDYVPALYNIAEMYRYGWGVEQDYAEAVNFYYEAAEKGHAVSQYHLGYMYEYGFGVRKDLKEARLWYNRAARQGITHVMKKYPHT